MGQRVERVPLAEDVPACVYSALCAHSWPSNGVNDYWLRHLTSVWKLISCTSGTLTETTGLPECTVLSLILKHIYLLNFTSLSADVVQLNPEQQLWAKDPVGSPHKSVSGGNGSDFPPSVKPFVSPWPSGLFSMQMWLANVTVQEGWCRPFFSAGVA